MLNLTYIAKWYYRFRFTSSQQRW